MSEVTATGYEGESFADRRLRTVTNLRAAHTDLAKVTFDADSGEGQILDQVLEAITDLDEAGQAAYNAADPASAADGSALAIARLRGTSPRAASKGQLEGVECDLDAGTYTAGALVAYVDGEPENRWVNIAEVTSTGGATLVDFEAETAGSTYGTAGTPYTAPTGQLTGMVAVSGWNSVTNSTDAAQGRDADTPAQTLKRSEAIQYRPGDNKLKSMRGQLKEVPGVIDARVVNGAGYVNPIVWDGITEDADDSAIADAIWAKLPPGIGTTGAIAALTSDGLYGVNFDRVTVQRLYVRALITGAVDKAKFKAALIAKVPTDLGVDVIWADLFVAGKLTTGVTNLDLFIGLSPAPTGTDDIAVPDLQIANLDTADISFS